MKEVCLVNQGENKNIINFSLGLDIKDNCNEEMILNNKKCLVLQEGSNDIVIIRNYNPYFIKKLINSETMLDVYAMGFEVIGNGGSENNTIIIQKSRGVKYNVKPLETLDDIAKKFGVDKQYIVETNLIKTEKLFVGQILII